MWLKLSTLGRHHSCLLNPKTYKSSEIFSSKDCDMLNPDHNASQYATISIRGTSPQMLPWERGQNLRRNSIIVEPTNPGKHLDPFSRLGLGRCLIIHECVRVCDVGVIAKECMSDFVELSHAVNSRQVHLNNGPITMH